MHSFFKICGIKSCGMRLIRPLTLQFPNTFLGNSTAGPHPQSPSQALTWEPISLGRHGWSLRSPHVTRLPWSFYSPSALSDCPLVGVSMSQASSSSLLIYIHPGIPLSTLSICDLQSHPPQSSTLECPVVFLTWRFQTEHHPSSSCRFHLHLPCSPCCFPLFSWEQLSLSWCSL